VDHYAFVVSETIERSDLDKDHPAIGWSHGPVSISLMFTAEYRVYQLP